MSMAQTAEPSSSHAACEQDVETVGTDVMSNRHSKGHCGELALSGRVRDGFA